MVIYGLMSILLVRGLGSGINLGDIKASLQGSTDQLTTGFSLFGTLVSNSGGSSSDAGAAYQSILLLTGSLAFIWALRQVSADKRAERIRTRQAFYSGMYPLVPFLLVLIVIALQLLPLVIGGSVYSMVISAGVAVSVLEKVLWGILFFLLSLLSLYMITSSVFALYIVTLPDMTPMKALRSARELVRYRRWTVLRKILFLPLALLVLAIVVMLPIVLFLTALGEWLFFVFTLAVLGIVHGYLYTLYRELL
jgi:hypothetical protein